MKSQYLIYSLCDPITYEIRYIGLSTSGLDRPKSHTLPSCIKKSKTKNNNWIKSLLNQGFKPIIQVIQYLPNKIDVYECEKYWIKYFKDRNANLNNHSDGGENSLNGISFTGKDNPFYNKKHTKETKIKMREAKLGKYPGNASKKVIDSKGNIFNSTTEAAKFHGYKRTGVKNIVCRYTKQTRDGISFKFLEESVG